MDKKKGEEKERNKMIKRKCREIHRQQTQTHRSTYTDGKTKTGRTNRYKRKRRQRHEHKLSAKKKNVEQTRYTGMKRRGRKQTQGQKNSQAHGQGNTGTQRPTLT